MPRIIPLGARVFVDELEPEIGIVKRAQKAGLYAVVSPENEPKPTTGVVVAVGNDPLIQDLVQVGDIVSFSVHAGVYQQVEGKQYRCLELRELISCIKPDEPTPLPSVPQG